MLPLTLFRQAKFAGPQVLVFGIAATFFAGFLYATIYLQNIVGLSPIETGLAYLPGTFLVFVVSGAAAGADGPVPARRTRLGRTGPARRRHAGDGPDHRGRLGLVQRSCPGLLIASVGCGLVNPSGSAPGAGCPSAASRAGLASGANDTFRQTGVAVGIAWLGTFIPAGSAFGAGDPQAYVDGHAQRVLRSGGPRAGLRARDGPAADQAGPGAGRGRAGARLNVQL